MPRFSSRKKQARLNFVTDASSSPQRSEAFVRIDGLATPAKKRKLLPEDRLVHDDSDDSSSSEDQITVRSKKETRAQLPTPLASSQVGLTGHDGAVDEPVTSARRTRRPVTYAESSDSDESLHQRNSTRVKTKKSITVFSVSSEPDDASEDSDPVAQSSKATKEARPARTRNARSFILGVASGTAPLATKIREPRTPSSNKKLSKRQNANSDEDQGSDDLTPSKSTRQLKRNASSQEQVNISDEDESEDDIPTPARRRLRQGRRTVNDDEEDAEAEEDSSKRKAPQSMDEQDEIQDDLEDLKDSEVRKSRTRGKPVMTERSKRLDRLNDLKRRRSGGTVPRQQTESEDESEDPKTPAEAEEPSDFDQYDQDFVDEDENQPLGVWPSRDVPLEYTHHASLKPAEYFQYEVEWMIHNKLDPAFDRHDEIYQLAHRKLDDEVKGHARSTYRSAAWRQDFDSAISTFPDLHILETHGLPTDRCQGCNRSGHPPTFTVTFSGPRYDSLSLEKQSSPDESSDSDKDSDSNSSPSSSENNDVTFMLGRFCCANAEIAHTLHHWRYHLNETVLAWLREHGHTAPEKIVARENWNQKKKAKLANRVVDGMVESGEMKGMYKIFKGTVEAARNTKPERFEND